MILSLALAQPSKQDAAFNTSLPSDGLRAFGVSHGMDQGAGPGQRRPPTKAASDQTVTAPDVGGWAMMHEREQVTRMGPLIKRLPNSLPRCCPQSRAPVQGNLHPRVSDLFRLDSSCLLGILPAWPVTDPLPTSTRHPGSWGSFHL